MTQTPWAILLTKFSDNNSEPSGRQFYDDLFTSSGTGTNNMVDFYRDASHGNIDASGSQVFGWFTLDQKRSDYTGSGPNPQGRTDLINWAKAKATANNVPLDRFFGVVVVMNVPTDLFGVLGGKAAVCDQLSLQPSLLGQEMSHGYGLDHGIGRAADYRHVIGVLVRDINLVGDRIYCDEPRIIPSGDRGDHQIAGSVDHAAGHRGLRTAVDSS